MGKQGPFFGHFLVTGNLAWEAPLGELLWFMFFDAIHHRGQLSTYIRPMGGKVPSIYGPSGDNSVRKNLSAAISPHAGSHRPLPDQAIRPSHGTSISSVSKRAQIMRRRGSAWVVPATSWENSATMPRTMKCCRKRLSNVRLP
jgi:hypothetical protein